MEKLKTFGSSANGRKSNSGCSCCATLYAIALTITFAIFYFKQPDAVRVAGTDMIKANSDCCANWGPTTSPVSCGEKDATNVTYNFNMFFLVMFIVQLVAVFASCL